jgi:hypothetical protein
MPKRCRAACTTSPRVPRSCRPPTGSATYRRPALRIAKPSGPRPRTDHPEKVPYAGLDCRNADPGLPAARADRVPLSACSSTWAISACVNLDVFMERSLSRSRDHEGRIPCPVGPGFWRHIRSHKRNRQQARKQWSPHSKPSMVPDVTGSACAPSGAAISAKPKQAVIMLTVFTPWRLTVAGVVTCILPSAHPQEASPFSMPVG